MLLGRRKEIKQIQEFLASPASGMLHLRGRRRIGKSTILKYLQRNNSNVFYYSGAKDASSEKTISDFAKQFDKFCNQNNLSKIRKDYLDWSSIFEQIHLEAKKRKLVIILDEIQWIAKKGTGVLGSIKAAWLDWKETGNIKLILCGSSNRFFQEQTGGELKVLRGLKTHSDIWIYPFSLSEVKKYYFPFFTIQEVALIYMMLGGVPYYLEQFSAEENFIRSINQTIFTRDTIFLEEYQEVLNLDFNTAGLATVKEMLTLVKFEGTTKLELLERTDFTETNLRYFIDKLVDYSIIFKRNDRLPRANARYDKYHIKDFYLNFYFKILVNLSERIRINQDRLLFAQHCLKSKHGFYIPNYSGHCFELLTQNILEFFYDLTPPVFEKLNIKEVGYKVYSKVKSKGREIDLVLINQEDREARLIETKWIGENSVDWSMVDQAKSTALDLPKGYRTSRYLLLSINPGEKFIKRAKSDGVTVLTLEDLVSVHLGV